MPPNLHRYDFLQPQKLYITHPNGIQSAFSIGTTSVSNFIQGHLSDFTLNPYLTNFEPSDFELSEEQRILNEIQFDKSIEFEFAKNNEEDVPTEDWERMILNGIQN